MNKIILIGGAPACGKTTVAARLSRELGIPWISTDSIRHIMRTEALKMNNSSFENTRAWQSLKSAVALKDFKNLANVISARLSRELGMPWISADSRKHIANAVVPEEGCSDLFFFNDNDPEIYLRNHSPEEIVADQNKESAEVWKGVKAFIDSISECESKTISSYIIEGVAVLPSLVYRDLPVSDRIKPIFFLDSDKKLIRKIIYNRGLCDEAKKYGDDLKNIEINWVLSFNEWLKEDLKNYNYPAIAIENRKDLIPEIMKVINF
jgi:2-phosphoglycerate kinase